MILSAERPDHEGLWSRPPSGVHRSASAACRRGGQISTAALPPAEGMRSHGFSGWYGLQAHRVNERIIQLARHHYHDTVAVLERVARASGAQPLIIGGHEDTISQFLAVLPAGLRDRFAGSFIADPHTLTPARVHDRASRVIKEWRIRRDQRIAPSS
jgi:hypothetical protein